MFPRSLILPFGRLCLLAAACAVAALPARAQEARRITFNEAVRIGLEQNIALKRAANTAEIQAINVVRERSNRLPNLGFNSSGSQQYGRNFIQSEGRIVNETTEYVGAQVSTGVTVFNGHRDASAVRQARLQHEAAELDVARARQTVVFSVMSTYVNLVERREMIGVQEENLETQRRLLGRIDELVKAGSRPIADLYQQQAEVATAELNLLDAQRAYQISEVNLVQVLQLDPFVRYEFEIPPVDTTLQPAPANLDINDMLRSAFERREDLRASEADIRASEQGIRIARSGLYPRIGLSLGYGTNYSTAARYFTGPNAGEVIGLFDQLDQSRGGSLGLNLNVPIFDRRLTRTNIEQARVQFENSRLALQELQQNIAVQVREAYLDYEMALQRIEATDKQEAAARLALEAAQARYDAAASTLIELSQAQSTYLRAQSDQVRARYNVVFQAKLIDYYLGVLDPSEPLFE